MAKSVPNGELVKRARFMAGQATAVAKMVESGRDDDDVLTQLLALRAAAGSALQLLARTRLAADLKRQLRRKLKDCPGACDYCDEVLALLDEIDLESTLKRLRVAS